MSRYTARRRPSNSRSPTELGASTGRPAPRQPFRIPAQFAFTGRAVGTLSSLATGLAPEFNLVSVAVPYAQTFLGLNRDGANQTAQQVLAQLLDVSRILLTLPATVDRVLSKVEAGQLQVRLADDSPNGTARGPGFRRALAAANVLLRR